MTKNLTIISYNVASSSHLSGLNQLISIHQPIFAFLQEVTLDTNSLNSILPSLYKGESNLDPDCPNKPGTAIIWLRDQNVTVFNLITCRVQILETDNAHFVNVYGHPGTQGPRDRRLLFKNELLPYLASHQNKLPLLLGDFNCVVRPQDVSNKVFGRGPMGDQGQTSHYTQKKYLRIF